MLENVQMVRSHGEKLYQSLYAKYISFSDEGGSRKDWFKYLKSFEDVEIIGFSHPLPARPSERGSFRQVCYI